jgi:hypothetical protein
MRIFFLLPVFLALLACTALSKIPIVEVKRLDDNPTVEIGINPVYMQIYTLARGLI